MTHTIGMGKNEDNDKYKVKEFVVTVILFQIHNYKKSIFNLIS